MKIKKLSLNKLTIANLKKATAGIEIDADPGSRRICQYSDDPTVVIIFCCKKEA